MDMHFGGVIFQTHARELARRIDYPHPPFQVLDLRPAADFAEGHIPGARTVTLSQLRRSIPAEADANTEFFLVGEGPDDTTVRRAALMLKERGAQRIVELPGGMLEWSAMGCSVVAGTAANPS